MTVATIDSLSEQQAKLLLHEIADTFAIGEEARTKSVLLNNVRHAANKRGAQERITALESMLEDRLDLIRCGIGANYSGDPKMNPLYTSVVSLLNKD